MTSLHLPWTPYRHSNRRYYVMNAMAQVVASDMTKQAAQFICQSANAHRHLVRVVGDVVGRLDYEDSSAAEGDNYEVWQGIHEDGNQALKDAKRPCAVSGEDY